MHKALFVAASMLFTVGAASADPYKWCAVDSGGGTNCGFVTHRAMPRHYQRKGWVLRAKAGRSA